MLKLNVFRALCFCFAAASAGVQAHGPHVHGAGELHVALDHDNLSIEFQSPLENLIGFEHVPRTDTQRAAVQAMVAKLNKPDALFKVPSAASCTARPTRIASALTGHPVTSPKTVKPAQNHDDDHADLTATFEFVCANVKKLDVIEVRLFDAFSGTRTLKTEVVGPRGQSAATLSSSQRLIRF